MNYRFDEPSYRMNGIRHILRAMSDIIWDFIFIAIAVYCSNRKLISHIAFRKMFERICGNDSLSQGGAIPCLKTNGYP